MANSDVVTDEDIASIRELCNRWNQETNTAQRHRSRTC